MGAPARRPGDLVAAATPPRGVPEDRGQRLATFERADGELRWSFDHYEGKPFVAARIWTRGTDGNFYPSKRGISVRVKELGDVIAALERAWRIASGEPDAAPAADPIPFGAEAPSPANAPAAEPAWLTRFHAKMDRRRG